MLLRAATAAGPLGKPQTPGLLASEPLERPLIILSFFDHLGPESEKSCKDTRKVLITFSFLEKLKNYQKVLTTLSILKKLL